MFFNVALIKSSPPITLKQFLTLSVSDVSCISEPRLFLSTKIDVSLPYGSCKIVPSHSGQIVNTSSLLYPQSKQQVSISYT